VETYYKSLKRRDRRSHTPGRIKGHSLWKPSGGRAGVAEFDDHGWYSIGVVTIDTGTVIVGYGARRA
jgi:hypothetical protein